MRIDRIMAGVLGAVLLIMGSLFRQSETFTVGLVLFGMSLCFENKE